MTKNDGWYNNDFPQALLFFNSKDPRLAKLAKSTETPAESPGIQ